MTTRVSPQLLDLSQIPVFRADTSGLSTIPTGLTGPTWFTAFSETFDTNNAFNVSNGRFQPTVAGYYLISARASYSSSGLTATYVGVAIGKNGGIHALASTPSVGGYPHINVTDVVYLNGSTDYVQVGTLHNASGSATDVSASITGALVRAA